MSNDIKRNKKKIICCTIIITLFLLGCLINHFYVDILPEYKEIAVGPYNLIDTFGEWLRYKIAPKSFDIQAINQAVMSDYWENCGECLNYQCVMVMDGRVFNVKRDGNKMKGTVESDWQHISGKFTYPVLWDFYAEIGESETLFWVNQGEIWYEKTVPNTDILFLRVADFAQNPSQLEYSQLPQIYLSDGMEWSFVVVTVNKSLSIEVCQHNLPFKLKMNDAWECSQFGNWGGIYIEPPVIPAEKIIKSEDWSFLRSSIES